MNNNALVVRWSRPSAGKEKKAIEHFNEFLGYLEKHQEKGDIKSFTPVFLDPVGEGMSGFILVNGEPSGLAKLTGEDAWTEHLMRAYALVDGFGVREGVTGKDVEARIRLYAKYL